MILVGFSDLFWNRRFIEGLSLKISWLLYSIVLGIRFYPFLAFHDFWPFLYSILILSLLFFFYPNYLLWQKIWKVVFSIFVKSLERQHFLSNKQVISYSQHKLNIPIPIPEFPPKTNSSYIFISAKQGTNFPLKLTEFG